MELCACFTTPLQSLSQARWLGMDERYAEGSILVCPDCGQHWLRVHIEEEAFTGSGRWYLGAVTAEQASTLAAGDAVATLESLSWYFYGGSYYGGRTGKTSGKAF